MGDNVLHSRLQEVLLIILLEIQFCLLSLSMRCSSTLHINNLSLSAIFFCNGIRWPLFSYLNQQLTVLINYLCTLDTAANTYTLRGKTHFQDVHNIAGPLVPYNTWKLPSEAQHAICDMYCVKDDWKHHPKIQ